MSTILYLNRSLDKASFDMLFIRHVGVRFTVYYRTDVTNVTVKSRKPDVLHFETHHDLLDYLEDTLDLILLDADTHPYASMDALIPGFPVVCLKPDNNSKGILIRAVRTWCNSAHET